MIKTNLLTEIVSCLKSQTNDYLAKLKPLILPTDPLFVFTKNGDVMKVQRLLINGAEPNIKHPLGWSPMHIAAIQAKPEIVKLLLKVSTTIFFSKVLLNSNSYHLNLPVWC